MKNEAQQQHLYWFSEDDFAAARKTLRDAGYRLWPTLMTPCQVLASKGRRLVYAPPMIWSQICARQGSWYRSSDRNGQTMVMSDHRLPAELDRFHDAEMKVSDFMPEKLPTGDELTKIVSSEDYQARKPDVWEGITFKDSFMFKILFTITRFWGWRDNLQKHWLGHRANHANFLSRHVTTEVDGEQVPYSVTDNAGVCSSCVEFFNVVEPTSRKLVRACPGAVTFGGAQREVYYDIKPLSAS